ncbi:sigma-70 family RNA polymerase sigma factor [Pseudoflavonifractor sp. 60]|uniref:sigma-70 family RNA polymerase sigma factor n=1 Tax=Pseudoflavonifractor sp. 60 TaxID=2304576 RepID=UPI001370EA64|nr:sigma-70 family RNA polymerase sigma factor [Pseudoflavonifractor sp. 60]NBI68418.1 sigma-70 family RNA polymerase sigma factor [Pseudoflavonifractor sp. 60]
MFDAKSDFALNKLDRDAIVCRSVTGVHIRLTREDFASEEEFLRWKVWSDGDYYDTEKDGRGFYDYGLPLDPRVDKLGAVPSIEADILAALDAAEASAEQARRTASLIEQIKSCLTGTQYRRLRMLYARKMNVTAIAKAEGISKASASRSISAALKNISAFFPEGGENR